MIEKRFKVAVYDENANGFAVLDLHKPNISKRLEYENVYIGSKEGCEIVCKFGNGLADENEQLKQQLNYIQNSISEHIKHQKTELCQNALKEIIEDYNEWLLGHKELILND